MGTPDARISPSARRYGRRRESGVRHIPIVCYHSISRDPLPWIAPFTVTPEMLAEHLDAVVEAQATTLTVSAFVQAICRDPLALPERTVLITFDDGFADFHQTALPAMLTRDIASTLYPATSFLQGERGPYGDRMLGFGALTELVAAGVELGGHSHSHPELDTLTGRRARDEVERCKGLLEDHLGEPIRTFAYPHGYSSRSVRAIVREAGYESACAVMDRFSSPGDDRFRLPRLLIRSTHSRASVEAWIRGDGAQIASTREPPITSLWRAYRRTAVRLRARRPVNL